MIRQPIIQELSTSLKPSEAFELFKDESYSFFLDSGMDPQRLGRYSFIGTDPFLVMKSRGNSITLISDGSQKNEQGNPFDMLHNLLEKYRLDCSLAPVPFCGGAVGYLSYDLCHFIERLPDTAIDDLQLPESYFAFYSTILAFDNLLDKTYIIASGFPEYDNEEQRQKRAVAQYEEIKARLAKPVSKTETNSTEAPVLTEAVLKCNFTPENYKNAVKKVRDYIIAGDIFQANISQRFETDLAIPPYELYSRLRRINPAPFASYLNFDDVVIVSASPERFLLLTADQVETRPIKGTRPRGKNAADDKLMAEELISSTKDRAA